MQYTVPQFIDTEDKIIAFITVRQFLIMIVASILIAVAYAAFSFTVFLIVAIVIVILTGVLAFVKINGRPFHFFLISYIERVKRPNIRVWNKELTDSELKHYIKVKKDEQPIVRTIRPRMSTSQLAQLSLIIDTSGSYVGEDVLETPKKQDKKTPPKDTPEIPLKQ